MIDFPKFWPQSFFPMFFLFFGGQPRSLDNDLGTIMKCGEEFDWQRINFVLEAGAKEKVEGMNSALVWMCLDPGKVMLER